MVDQRFGFLDNERRRNEIGQSMIGYSMLFSFTPYSASFAGIILGITLGPIEAALNIGFATFVLILITGGVTIYSGGVAGSFLITMAIHSMIMGVTSAFLAGLKVEDMNPSNRFDLWTIISIAIACILTPIFLLFTLPIAEPAVYLVFYSVQLGLLLIIGPSARMKIIGDRFVKEEFEPMLLIKEKIPVIVLPTNYRELSFPMGPVVTHQEPQISSPEITILSGVDTVGEDLKIAIKIVNESSMAITGVTVTLDAPDGLMFTKGSSATLRLGAISPNGGFQSAIYWLRPDRCIDDSFGGVVVYRDAKDSSYSVDIPRKKLVNICPMLKGTESPREIFAACKYGGLSRNNASFTFTGDPAQTFQLAIGRISSLIPVEKVEQNVGEKNYLAYLCVVGETKYGDNKFAAEIQVSGNPAGGILTITIYSDDERILSGFIVDTMLDVRQHVEILEEKSDFPPTQCSNCGAQLDLSNLQEGKFYTCESCDAQGVIPPWLVAEP